MENGQSPYNCATSRMWVKLNQFFQKELFDNFKILRETVYTYENVCNYLITQQIDCFPEIAYNKDIYAKYIAQGRRYLHMLHGNDKAHILRWMYNRFLYVDSLFLQQNSPYTKASLTVRSNAPTSGPAVENLPPGVRYRPTFLIETYVPQYVTICWRKNTYVTQRVGWGEKVEFTYDMVNSTDNEIIIYCAGNLKRFGDLSQFNPTSIDIAQALKLVEIKCNNSPGLLKSDLSGNAYLKTVDFKGCSNLGNTTGGANVLDISKCTNLRSIDLRGTSITAVVTNVNGGNLQEIRYSEKTESITLLNQTNLKVVGIPEGATSLTSMQITNCDGIETLKYPYTPGEPIDLSAMRHVQNLTLENCLGEAVKNINFEGFSKLTNLTLRNMLLLESIGFDNMMSIDNAPTLKNVTINNCPKIKTLTMNVTSDDYKVAFDDANLDLRYATSIKRIEANGPLIGLKSIYLPNSLKDLILKLDYNTNLVSDIEDIFSVDGLQESKTDGFTGMNPLNLVLKNIDLSSVKKIVNSRNMNIEVENDFIIQGSRDGKTYPYFLYNGRVDLSEFKGSYVGAFKNWDLSNVDFVYTKDITQSDFTSTFEGATFGETLNLDDFLNRILEAANCTKMFAGSNINRIIFPQNMYFAVCDNMFAGCKNLTVLTEDMVMPEGILTVNNMFDGCTNLSEAHIAIPNSCSDMNRLFRGCNSLKNIDGFIMGEGVLNAINWVGGTPIESADNVIIKALKAIATSGVSFQNLEKLKHCENLTFMPDMPGNLFNNCVELESVSFNIDSNQSTTSHQNMFKNCKKLVNCDLSNFDVSNSSRYESMFMSCESLTTPPILYIPKNCLSTTMYYGCNGITSFDGFVVDTGNANNMENWNLQCNNVRTARNMTIKSKINLGKIDKNNWCWPVESFAGLTLSEHVTNIDNMFQGNPSLKEDISIPSHVTSAIGAFKNCIGMTKIHANWNNNYTGRIVATNCYSGCSAISEIDGIAATLNNVPTAWGGRGVAYNAATLDIVLNELPDNNGNEVKYLELSSKLKAQLTNEQILEIINKNYTII